MLQDITNMNTKINTNNSRRHISLGKKAITTSDYAIQQLSPIASKNKYECHQDLTPKLSAKTMQQAISMLKMQLRTVKTQSSQQKQILQEKLQKQNQQIEKLKKKIVHLNEKEYLQSILNEGQQEEELQSKKSDKKQIRQLKVLNQKLQRQLHKRENQIVKFKDNIEILQGEIEKIEIEKQKHLQLSVVEKINLQERVEILERQISSKQGLLIKNSENSQAFTQRQIKLKKAQRKINKKTKQLEYIEKQLSEFNKFETSKLKLRLKSMQEENTFLKGHINKLQADISSINCKCNCVKDVDLFKNKYISKSRQLSKVKVQLGKQMFKEKFMNQHKIDNAINQQPFNKTYQSAMKQMQQSRKTNKKNRNQQDSNCRLNQHQTLTSAKKQRFRKNGTGFEENIFNLSRSSDQESKINESEQEALLSRYSKSNAHLSKRTHQNFYSSLSKPINPSTIMSTTTVPKYKTVLYD